MKLSMKNLSVKVVVIALAAGVVAGCSLTKPHEKAAAAKADQAGLSAVERSRFDGTFVAPNAQFAQYRKLLVEQLDLSEVQIRKQTTDKIKYIYVYC